MYRIKRFDFVSGDIIKKAIEMDHLTFQFADWITEEDANLIYMNKKDCLIWLMHDDEPIGLATVFALNKDIPDEAVKRNKPVYKLLTQAVLSDQETGILYCHCFLLLPEYRGKGLIYLLYDGLREWLEEKGEVYSTLYADAVSADGCRCLERLGFNPIHSFGEEGTLYRAEKVNVMNKK
jgi:Acetyltransferase (GNAT) family.